jgi:hypothetical protein
MATEFTKPLSFHAWKSEGNFFFLIGNLETGITGDSRLARDTTIFVGSAELNLEPGEYHFRETNTDVIELSQDKQGLVFRLTVPPESCLIYLLEKVK